MYENKLSNYHLSLIILMLWMPRMRASWMMHWPTMLVAPFCTIESPIHTLTNQGTDIRDITIFTTEDIPGFRLTKSSSILNAVKGLTVTVAAYSTETSLRILCQELCSFTTYVCHVPVRNKFSYYQKRSCKVHIHCC